MYRIITLDGGGVWGLLSARILDRLSRQVPGLIENTNLFAGTSIGGIMALGLANGMPARRLVNMHQVHSTSIFTPNRWHFAGLFGSRYTDKGIRKVAETLFGNRTLGDLDRKVLIPAFDLNHYKMNGQRRWTPKFFHNFGESPDLVVRAADVARYTSAAPTYFPIADGYIDGGVVCNNPSIPAISRVLDSRTGVPGVTLDDIVVLSLGTGRAQSYIDSLNGKWGKIQWSDRFIEMMMDGANDASHKECQRLLGPRYIRIDPTLSANIPLDGHDRLDEIMRISDEISLNPAISWAKLQWPKEA